MAAPEVKCSMTVEHFDYMRNSIRRDYAALHAEAKAFNDKRFNKGTPAMHANKLTDEEAARAQEVARQLHQTEQLLRFFGMTVEVKP